MKRYTTSVSVTHGFQDLCLASFKPSRHVTYIYVTISGGKYGTGPGAKPAPYMRGANCYLQLTIGNNSNPS